MYEGRFFVAVNICVFHPDKIGLLGKYALEYNTQYPCMSARTARIELAPHKHVYVLFLQDNRVGGEHHYDIPNHYMSGGHFIVDRYLPAMDLADMRVALREERAMIIQQSQKVLEIELSAGEKFKLAVMGVVAKSGVLRTRDPFKVRIFKRNNIGRILNPPEKLSPDTPIPYPPIPYGDPLDIFKPRP
jgi:hypothetical protein